MLVSVLLLLGLAGFNTAHADRYVATIDVFKKSGAVKPFFESAYGYAVFPIIGKAGFVVGGAYGTGKVYVNGAVTGTTRLIKASIGFQAGGQAFSQIVFFQDKRAYDEFTSGSFEFDAGLSAVAITAGAQARAGTGGMTAGASAGPATGTQAPTAYHKGMAVFVHATGGLMFEATIGGQKFSYEKWK
jgi:lipid-binding SYLF domain-containing protein